MIDPAGTPSDTAVIHGDPAVETGTYDGLMFLLLPSTGRVHVQAGEAQQVRLAARAGVDADDDGPLAVAMALMLGPVASLCGDYRPSYRETGPARPYRWHRVDTFADSALCGACCRALGPDSPLAFRHRQPDDDPEDP